MLKKLTLKPDPISIVEAVDSNITPLNFNNWVKEKEKSTPMARSRPGEVKLLFANLKHSSTTKHQNRQAKLKYSYLQIATQKRINGGDKTPTKQDVEKLEQTQRTAQQLKKSRITRQISFINKLN